MSDIPVNRENLKIARLNAGYSTIEATQKICSSNSQRDRVSEWENGENIPTWNQLKKMSNYYETSIFVLTGIKKIKRNRQINDFRQLDYHKDLSLNTKKYLNLLLQRQSYLSNFLKKEKAKKNALVSCAEKTNSPIALAEIIRNRLNYQHPFPRKNNHLEHLISLIEEQGVFVMKTLSYWKIEVADMRGMYLKDDYAPIIALNRRDAKSAQLFTLAHEIAHLFINSEAISNIDFRDSTSNEDEIFCNKVAANLLLPKSYFSQDHYSLRDIEDIANKYEVSRLFVFYRLKNLKKINPGDIVYFQNTLREETNISTSGTSGNGHPTYNNNMKGSNGKLFNRFIASLYFENKINALEASKILRFSIERA